MFDLKNAKKVKGEKKDSLQTRREKKICTNLWGLWSDPYGARLVPGLKPLSLPRAHYVASSPGSLRPRRRPGRASVAVQQCMTQFGLYGDFKMAPQEVNRVANLLE